MLCEDPISMLAVHIPEEDRCIDVLELIEMERLLRYNKSNFFKKNFGAKF